MEDPMEDQKPAILAAFLSWLHYEAHLSKDDDTIWVVQMHDIAPSRYEIIHANVFAAVLHGMAGFPDDVWRFDAIQQRLGEWCETVDEKFTSNISMHAKEWGPLVVEDIQMMPCISVLQRLDVFIHSMEELMLEYPDELDYHWDDHKKAVRYRYMAKLASPAA